jgi:DNA-3-methyladenine glycosylase
MTLLPPSFFAGDAVEVAPRLLQKVFVHGGCSGRIVEVEAYTADDPASHSFRGRTPRNATMFGPPGRLYVYFTYGMHHCVNIVTGSEGDGQAVLLRAVVPLTGVDVMRARRHGRRDLCGGPAKLAEAFAIDRSVDGMPAVVLDDGVAPPEAPLVTARVGITRAADWTRRWLVPSGSSSRGDGTSRGAAPRVDPDATS